MQSPKLQSPVSISIRGLGFSYNGHPALQDLSLDVHQGEFVALMGRNGAGKTTLLKQLVGLLTPDQGQVQLMAPTSREPLDTRKASVEEIIKYVGYVPQNPNALLFNDTVGQELDFTRRGHGLPPETLEPVVSDRSPWRRSWWPSPRSFCSTSPHEGWTMCKRPHW